MSYLASNSPHVRASVPRISNCRNPFTLLVFLVVLLAPLTQSGCLSLSGNLAASQTILRFGNVAIGSSSKQSLTIMNSSPVAVTVTNAVVSGRGFTVTGPPLPLTLAEGQSAIFTARFAPPAIGDASGSLLITKSQVSAPQLAGGSGSATPSATTKLETIAMTGAGIPLTPTITTQPASQTVIVGQTATFSVTSSGAAPLSYQWEKNGTAISGATSTTYTTPATATLDSGSLFTVVVSNSAGDTTSNAATLTVDASPSSITVNPNFVTIKVGNTQQFVGISTGTSNTAVTWSVSGVGCTGAACGMISASGLYTSPSSVPSPATVTVKATTVADPTKSASASVTIVAAVAVLLSISPTSPSVPTVGTQLFSASVTGTSNKALTWNVSGTSCSGSSCGTISTSASSAVYSAPPLAPTPASVSVTATSVADPTKSASASVTIIPVIAVAVNPTNVSVPTGTTQQFNASVTGTSNTAVAWSVTGAGCNGVACGKISSGGLYTAPAVVPSPATVTVTATSVADPSKSAAINLTIVGSGKNGPALPTLPQATVDLTMPTQIGTIRNVSAGDAKGFQNAINAATCGDTIVLVAGSVYTGTFTLPNMACSTGWVVIESSAVGSLPAPGTRISTGTNPPSAGTLANMARIQGNGGKALIQSNLGAHNYRFIGIEFTTASLDANEYVFLLDLDPAYGPQGPVTLNSQGEKNIIIDRCYIHGYLNLHTRHAINWGGSYEAIVDSDCREIHEPSGGDSNCVGGWNATGPILIQNNFLSAASENVIFGGAVPQVANTVTQDITVTGNYFWKDFANWNGKNFTVKNLFELKNANRILLDGNVLQYSWLDGQNGVAILSNPGKANAVCSWCEVYNWTITHNLIENVGAGITINHGDDLNPPSLPTDYVLVQNNLIYSINQGNYRGYGYCWEILVDTASDIPSPDNLTIDHNTCLSGQTGIVQVGDTGTVAHSQFTNQMADYGAYGILGNAVGVGSPVILAFFPNMIYNQNALIGCCLGNTYPHSGGLSGTTLTPSTDAAVGFTNYSGGTSPVTNYQLLNSSAYHNAGTDGKDIGIWDWSTLNTETNNALAGRYPQ